jgi:hypothetical protein
MGKESISGQASSTASVVFCFSISFAKYHFPGMTTMQQTSSCRHFVVAVGLWLFLPVFRAETVATLLLATAAAVIGDV